MGSEMCIRDSHMELRDAAVGRKVVVGIVSIPPTTALTAAGISGSANGTIELIEGEIGGGGEVAPGGDEYVQFRVEITVESPSRFFDSAN